MANFLQSGDDYKVTIPRWKEEDKTIFYEIAVDVAGVIWKVIRRYSEFNKLHIVLVTDHGVQADIFPPKKVLGNRDNEFVEKRRQALETYLAVIVRFLQKSMPKKLAVFLKFQLYDVTFIVKNMAVNFYQCGEVILTKLRNHTMTPLELFAINERLKQPCTTVELVDQREDLSHVLDLCYQLTDLTISGSEKCIEGSNIVPNNLPIHLVVFKSLESLSLNNCNLNNIADLGSIRTTVKRIHIQGGNLTNLVDILLCDQVHKTVFDRQNEWNLTEISIDGTQMDKIDPSICLAPNIKSLTLNNNQICEISNIGNLEKLSTLSITHNVLRIEDMINANRIVSLDLSENFITTLKPFAALMSLENLNLLFNKIDDVTEVRHVCSLQYLEVLVLTGNPVSQIIDYRIKVLEFFGDKAYRICLDLETTGQAELDKVAIMTALHSQRKHVGSP